LRLAEIPKTLLKKWHINSTLQLTIRGEEEKKDKSGGTTVRQKVKANLDLDTQMMNKWKRAIAGKETSRGRLGENPIQLDSTSKP
jgi:hypothetical protein